MDDNKKEYTFIWFIENYSFCWHKMGETLLSPVFAVDGLERTAWTVHLYPRGEDNDDEGRIVIKLNRKEDNGPDVITVNYHLSIVAEDESTLYSNHCISDFSKKTAFGWSFLDLDEITLEQKDEYLPNDVLTVCCKLSRGDEGNVDTVAPICARTRIGIGNISFLHVVECFSALKPNQKMTYHTYSSTSNGRVKSCVYISKEFRNKVMVEITLPGSDQILSMFDIYLLEVSGKKTKCAKADNRFNTPSGDIRRLFLSFTKDEIMAEKSEYLHEDKLYLICECLFSTGIEFQKIEGIQNTKATMDGKLVTYNPHMKYFNIFTEKFCACPSALEDLKGIYSSNFLTDAEIKTKTNSFPAHKIVLCARSPVFKAMMSNDMKVRNSGSIQVDDLEDDTVLQLLLFLYSDNLEGLQWKNATKLYYAAYKYQIEKLKLLCSSFLIHNLTISTVAELLLLAYDHSDSDLQNVVENFILDYDEQVFISMEWEKFMEEKPLLALKIHHLTFKKKLECE